jgi:hypothetical protein
LAMMVRYVIDVGGARVRTCTDDLVEQVGDRSTRDLS